MGIKICLQIFELDSPGEFFLWIESKNGDSWGYVEVGK